MDKGIFMPNRLGLSNLKGDLYGGITAAVVALPLAMAFGVASGAGPAAGLYGAAFVGLFASLFGGTRSQVSGPTGPMTVVMAGVFTKYTAMDPVSGPAIAFTVVIMGGFFQVLMGAFRLGRYINLVPYPVISGFMSGIGAIIIILQFGPLLGHVSTGGPMAVLRELPNILAEVRPYSLGLGVFTMLVVYLLPSRINRLVPAPLFALLAGTIGMLLLLPEGSVSTLGDIPRGMPRPIMPEIGLRLLPSMIKSALVLALLGSIDSLLTSLVADSMTRTYHDPDKELVGQGIGNAIAGLFGGLPGAGATMRTVVNIRAGGKTPASGVFHAVLLFALVLGAGSLASHIPHVVLAGILMKVGTDIIDWQFLKRAKHAPRSGLLLMLAVFLITVFVDLITAVAVGVIAASLMQAQSMADLQIRSMRTITEPDEESPLCEEAMTMLKAAGGKVMLYHLSGPLSFGAAKDMARRLSMVGGYDVLILDLSEVSHIDFTAAVAIYDMVKDAQTAGKHVLLSGVSPDVRGILNRLGVLALMREGHEFERRLQAVYYAADLLGIELPRGLSNGRRAVLGGGDQA